MTLASTSTRPDDGAPGWLVEAAGLGNVRSNRTGPLNGNETSLENDADFTVSPSTIEQVAAVLGACHGRGVAVVPQGGRTGLVGGTIAGSGQVALSLHKLNRIERLDPVERTAVVQAGTTLAALQEAAASEGLETGIDLPSRGTATIGGMVSTNAGGISAFRHGVMRHRVLGLEAVLPDGSIYSDITRVVKNTAGYDLKHLFIGAEGTLGVVTRAALKLEPAAKASATALFGLPSTRAALDLVAMALRCRMGRLRAAEALWRKFIRLTASRLGWSENGMDLEHPVYLLLSLEGDDREALQAQFEDLFCELSDRFSDATGIIASSQRQEEGLWKLREDTDIIYREYRSAPSYDVSVPLTELEDYVQRVQADLRAVDGGIDPFVFGHVADGNLHIVLDRPGPLPDALAIKVESVLYERLSAIGGSFSAEHGIGSKRIDSLFSTVSPTKLKLMQQLKTLLDPDALLNPGKVLPLAPSSVRAPRGGPRVA